MLDIFVRKPFATRALCKAHAFSERAVVGFRICGVEGFDWEATLDADWHCGGYMARGMDVTNSLAFVIGADLWLERLWGCGVVELSS